MPMTVYCHQCEKRYPTTKEDLERMIAFDPEHMIVSGSLYNYSGGCYFKNLNRLKRLEKETQLRKASR